MSDINISTQDIGNGIFVETEDGSLQRSSLMYTPSIRIHEKRIAWGRLKVQLANYILQQCMPILFRQFGNLNVLTKDKESDVKQLARSLTLSLLDDSIFMNVIFIDEFPFISKTKGYKDIITKWCKSLPYFSEAWNFIGSASYIQAFRTYTFELLMKQANILNKLYIIERVSSSSIYEQREYYTFKNVILNPDTGEEKCDIHYVTILTPMVLFNCHYNESMNPTFTHVGDALIKNMNSINTYLQENIKHIQSVNHELVKSIPELVTNLINDMKTPIKTNLPYVVTIDKIPIIESRHIESLILLQTVDKNYPAFISELHTGVKKIYEEFRLSCVT